MYKCVISIFLTRQKGNKRESLPGNLRMPTAATLGCALCGEFQRQPLQFFDLMVKGTFDCWVPTRAPCKLWVPCGRSCPWGLMMLYLWQRKEEVMSTHYTHTLSASLKSMCFLLAMWKFTIFNLFFFCVLICFIANQHFIWPLKLKCPWFSSSQSLCHHIIMELWFRSV